MPHFLQRASHWFFSDYRFSFQSYWFKVMLYVFLLVKSIYWLAFYDVYFGEYAIVYARFYDPSSFRDLAFLLYSSSSPKLAYAFILPLIVLSLLCLKFKSQYFLMDLLSWFLVVNINNKLYPTLTGGDYLLNQFLLFNCFLTASFAQNDRWRTALKKFLHNMAVVSVLVQVCLVYFLSALAKCIDPDWISGRGIGIISMVDHYNLVDKVTTNGLSGLLFVGINYLILFYQLTFPALVWIRRIKRPFIMIGLAMHLYIIFVMGIVEFGTIMIMSYVYFWPFKKAVP